MARTKRRRPTGYRFPHNEFFVPYEMRHWKRLMELEREAGLDGPGDYRRLPDDPYGEPIRRQHRRGGLLMSYRNTGRWDDECSNGKMRKSERRYYKRRERQKVKREMATAY